MLRILLTFAILLPGLVRADWQLLPEASTLTLVAVKNAVAMETYTFNDLRGFANLSGHAELQIPLGSIDTGVPLRDARIEEFLFEINQFAFAKYAVDIRLQDVTLKLKAGESAVYSLGGALNLRGITRKLPAEVIVTRLPEDGFQISSRRPLLVSAADFNAGAGLEKLRELAGLQTIAPAVAVSFSLIYRRVDF